MTTQLEDLPSELILEIFSNTKIQGLSRAFWNLNTHLNQLIRACQSLNLVLNRCENSMVEWELFSEQIVRLVIVTLDNFDFTRLTNIRSLKLNLANENHLKQIQAHHFPHLVYLSIANTFSSKSTQSLAQQVFSNQFLSLRYAELGQIAIPSSLSSWSQTYSLRAVIIVAININIVPFILQSCPRLTHLQIRITGEENFAEETTVPNHPLKQLTFLQSRLSTFVCDIIPILSLVPNLRHLDLTLCTRSFFNLVQFIAHSFLSLRRFDCYIIEHPNENEKRPIEQIRNLHRYYATIEHTLREDYFSLYTTAQNKNRR